MESLTELLQPVLDMLETAPMRAEVVRTRYDEDREPVSPAVRAIVFRRDKYRCVWCASRADLQLDHLVPWSAGGPDTVDNLRILCGTCNERRSNHVTPLDAAVSAPPAVHSCLRCDPDLRGDSRLQTVYCTRGGARGAGVIEGMSR